MGTNSLPVYVGLSIKEFQALASVSGEALRLYLAVSSFAMGQKTTCFPKWSQIKEAMGKPKADTRNLKRVAKQLEDAGLVKRGEFGAKDRWRLLLKEQVQIERGSKIPLQNNHHTGSNLPPEDKTFHHLCSLVRISLLSSRSEKKEFPKKLINFIFDSGPSSISKIKSTLFCSK